MGLIAAIFPGQGSQYVGMGKDVASLWEEAAAVFREADSALGAGLSKLCWEGPEEELKLTANTQPAILTHSVAVWRILEREGFSPDGFAGHSLGEYSAAVAAGSISFSDAVRTVRLRGKLMQDAAPQGTGAMAAVMGLDPAQVEEICTASSQEGSVVVPANYNSPQQIVISGHAEAVRRACALAKERGAKRCVELPVSAPFHSPLMEPAAEGLAPTLKDLEISSPCRPLYRNVDAEPVSDSEELREGLIRQVASPVKWLQTIQRMVDDGFDTFVEIGPGKVLTGLVRKTAKGARCIPVGTSEQVKAFLEELAHGG